MEKITNGKLVIDLLNELTDQASTRFIRKVVANAEQKFVMVWFNGDETPITVHCDKDDDFSIEVGVALALCKSLFGSSTQFRREIADVLIEQKPKAKKVKKTEEESAKTTEKTPEENSQEKSEENDPLVQQLQAMIEQKRQAQNTNPVELAIAKLTKRLTK